MKLPIGTSMAWVFLFARIAIYMDHTCANVILNSIRSIPRAFRLWPIYYALWSALETRDPPVITTWRVVDKRRGWAVGHSDDVCRHIFQCTFSKVIGADYKAENVGVWLDDIRPPGITSDMWVSILAKMRTLQPYVNAGNDTDADEVEAQLSEIPTDVCESAEDFFTMLVDHASAMPYADATGICDADRKSLESAFDTIEKDRKGGGITSAPSKAGHEVSEAAEDNMTFNDDD
jgi:hypothetical protein